MRISKTSFAFCVLICVFFLSFNDSACAVQLITPAGPSFAPRLGGSGDSGLSLISQDGRYLLFASTANNLVLTNNNNFVLPCRFNVYRRDTVAGTTTLVSVNRGGTGGGNGDSFPSGISTNGQFALFESSASDLVANDTNNVSDIFVRDLINGTTTLVSINPSGGPANGTSRGSVMTPDGRYVAFVSTATNLVSHDINGIADIFVRDLQAGTTTLVSVGAVTNSNPPVTGTATSSESPEITPDGRYVAFLSAATNLVKGATTSGEIYVRDLVAGNTTWASTNARAIFNHSSAARMLFPVIIVSATTANLWPSRFAPIPPVVFPRAQSFCATASRPA
jgi:Tol biopolymer transport system component